MNASAPEAEEAADDYALSRVPESARHSWVSVAVQRFGQVSSFQQFLVGAVLGFQMSFWNAFWAITFGSVLLEIITILLGIAGVREGLSTSVLARWCGFGRKGSAAVGLLIALSLAGWFGVQNGVFAQGMHDLAGWAPEWAWAALGGAIVTGVTLFGFGMMARVAYLTVPAFLFLAAYSIIDVLAGHSLGDLVTGPPPGPSMSLAEGTTLVAGAFILGAIMTPDMTRFNRRPSDVVKQTLISVTVGEYLIGLTAVLLGHAAHRSDVVGIIVSSSGLLGTLVLATAILKINDWNLYSASLGLVNSLEVLSGRRVSRRTVTVVIGIAGTVLSAMGIVDHFTGFLTTIGVLAPPVAGIIIAEYFVVRRFRGELDRARELGQLPAHGADWLPLSLVCWAIGAAVGNWVDSGIAAVNSVAVAFLLYAVVGRLTSVRKAHPTPQTCPRPTSPTLEAAVLPLVTREELRAEIDAGTVVVVDTMPADYYSREHLPTAVNIPGFPYEDAARFTEELAPSVLPDRRAAIVVYCANVPCRNSELVGARLRELGYDHVRKYREGIEDWLAGGLPTETSEPTEDPEPSRGAATA